MQIDVSGLGFEAGQHAVVTGAALGIGRATALMLARAGVTVVAWDIDEANLDVLAKEISAAGGVCHGVVADLSTQDAIDAAWATTRGFDAPVQYLVNNAGPAARTPLDVAAGVALAVGSYAMVADGFVANYPNSAISMTYSSSVAGNLWVRDDMADWYPAAKAAIAGLMRHHAVKHRGRPRVNAVAPLYTNTQRIAKAMTSERVREHISRYPIPRVGEPEEVAVAICFLLAPAASYINGVLIPLEGGATWTLS